MTVFSVGSLINKSAIIDINCVSCVVSPSGELKQT